MFHTLNSLIKIAVGLLEFTTSKILSNILAFIECILLWSWDWKNNVTV